MGSNDSRRSDYENEVYKDPYHSLPENEPWDEKNINDYLRRLESSETDSVSNITQMVLKFSAWGAGLSFAYVKLSSGFEFTTPSMVFFVAAWVFWLISVLCIYVSYYWSAVNSWFHQSVGLYRRYLPGMYWVYRERFYMAVKFSGLLLGLGFLSIVGFIALDLFYPTPDPDTTE